MPEAPFEKAAPHPFRLPEAQAIANGARTRRTVAYAELGVTSNFTFLTGASHPEEMVRRAAELGHQAAAICDVNTLAGVVRAHVAAKQVGIPLAVGSRLRFTDVADVEAIVYPTNRSAYARLCQLLTLGKRRAPKGECHLSLDDFLEHSEGLLAIVHCTGEAVNDDAVTAIQLLREALDDERLSLALTRRYDPDDQDRLRALGSVGEHCHVPLVAMNDAHYHIPQRRPLQDVLTCIRHGCTIDEAGVRLHANAERHLKPPEEMARLFAAYPEAIARTIEIARRASAFSLDELRYEYPVEPCPSGLSAMQYLRERAWAGARRRYPRGMRQRVRDQIEYELRLIDELQYEAYFLTCYDIVEFARSRDILCQGRGGAANSSVCYCLGITEVDPARFSLLFERFVSRARNEPPDIDIDFEHERREEVIQYLYEKYGRDRAALTAEVISYRGRSAVREVGKAMGLSLGCVEALAKNLDRWHDPANAERVREVGLDPDSLTMRQVIALTNQLVGFPRHLSQHVGGFVITRTPLCELVPIENAAMEDRTVIEWDKDDIDAMNMLKVDCLGLGMLTCIRKAFGFVEATGRRSNGATKGGWSHQSQEMSYGNSADLSGLDHLRDGTGDDGVQSDSIDAGYGAVRTDKYPTRVGDQSEDDQAIRVVDRTDQRRGSHPPGTDPQSGRKAEPVTDKSRLSIPFIFSEELGEDPAVYAMIQKADTLGVFQIESRAQMSMLPRLKPANFYDLVIEVAIVRPGPIQGGMVHPYLRRRAGEEPVTYPSEDVKDVLGRTLGVPIFQEQAMQLAIVAAGFTPDEADRLRRAMAAWKRKGDDIHRFGQRLISGMLQRGYPREFAERCFEQIKGFSDYGFPESHAASFAILVYVSCWLKRYHPAAFAAALINSQPMGFYQPAQIIGDAREHGVEVRSVDVNHSAWDCTLESRHNAGDSNVDDPSSWGKSGPAIRLGMRMVRGLKESDAERITESVAKGGPFHTVESLWRDSGVSITALRKLARADAFGSMNLDRQRALWQIKPLRDERLPLFEKHDGTDERGLSHLPSVPVHHQVLHDYASTGLSLKAHPISFAREYLDGLGVTRAEELRSEVLSPQGRQLAVAGVVLVRQRPGTASGVVFVTLEDETGIANLIIWRDTFEKYRRIARMSTALLVRGHIERQGEVVHLHVAQMESLDEKLPDLMAKSRNFH